MCIRPSTARSSRLVAALLLISPALLATIVAPTQAQSGEAGVKESAKADSQAQSEVEAAHKKESPQPTELQGDFQAVKATAIELEPKQLKTLKVEAAVEHGQAVSKGEIVIQLDREPYEESLRNAQRDLRSAEIALHEAEVQLDVAKRRQKLALQAAERADRVATEELKKWVTAGREQRVKSIERSVQSARNSLEYQQEELRQLEKMYEADDLTEETEEIILKRTRDAVEAAQYYLERAEQSAKEAMEYELPRTEENLHVAIREAALALEEARALADTKIEKQQIALDKQREELEKKHEALQELRQDRRLLEIKAPYDGYAYYGESSQGKWSTLSAAQTMLQPGSSLKPNTVVMTIARPSPLVVQLSVPEAQIRHLEAGKRVTVRPLAFSDAELRGKIERVSHIPVSDGSFEAVITVKLGDWQDRLVPGMKAKVVIPIEKEQPEEKKEHSQNDESDDDGASS